METSNQDKYGKLQSRTNMGNFNPGQILETTIQDKYWKLESRTNIGNFNPGQIVKSIFIILMGKNRCRKKFNGEIFKKINYLNLK